MLDNKNLFLFGLLGLGASVMVGIGEFLIHYNSNPIDSNISFSYLLGIAEDKTSIGHFLMIPFIPLYVFGYFHLYYALKPGSKRLASAVLTLGIFAFVVGGIWVGSRAHLSYTVNALSDLNNPIVTDKIVASYEFHMESLVQALRVIILLLSICFSVAILKGGTLYPKWMAIFNPITLLLVVFALFLFVRPLGQYLAPTAMNVAHFVLFSASLFALRSKT